MRQASRSGIVILLALCLAGCSGIDQRDVSNRLHGRGETAPWVDRSTLWLAEHLPAPVLRFIDLVGERWSSEAVLQPYQVAIAAAIAVLITVLPLTWRVSRQAATIIHEMGHVLTAWLSGRRVVGIKLHSDTSGVTISSGSPRGFGILLTTLAGYPAPSLLAVAMAMLAGTGHSGAALTLYQLVVLACAFLALNVFGLLSALISLGVTGVIWWHGAPDLIAFTVIGLAVFYAGAGLRCSFDVVAAHRRAPRGQVLTTDAAQAARAMLIPVPSIFWLFFFVLISAISLASVVGLLFATMM